MRMLKLRDLEAGMVLSRDITTKHGQTIAQAGCALTDQQIARMSFYKIDYVYVEGEDPKPEPEEEPQPEQTEEKKPEEKKKEAPKAEKYEKVKLVRNETMSYTQWMKGSSEYQEYTLHYSKAVAYMKEIFAAILAKDYKKVDKKKILASLDPMIKNKTTLDILDNIQANRSNDDSVYAHSLNVSLISRGIAKWMKVEKEQLNTVTLAGYFYSIGKLLIPDEVMHKSGKLTEAEFALIRTYPKKSEDILKKIPGLEWDIIAAAGQHHERYDGSGYPNGLGGDDINHVASIVGVADVYDAMTAARTYRAPKCAFQVIEAFENDGLSKYEPAVIMAFLDHMASSYQNSRVVLSDGRACQVVFLNKHKRSKPMVRMDDGEVIDLSKAGDLSITSIL